MNDGYPALARLVKWFVGDALPRWVGSGYDDVQGQFLECLAVDGLPESSGLLRTRSAARQIYVYAHAHALGVGPLGGLERAERAFANLHDRGWISVDRPGYARSFNRITGALVDPVRDLYDHACVLLALAWLFKATGRSLYLQHIENTLEAVDTTLSADFGGWAEDSKKTLPRRQNPHMHFFEACLALMDVTGETIHRKRSDALFALFETRFFDLRMRVLREYFGAAWEIDETSGSQRLEPGHMCEWVWLLRKYAAMTSVPVEPYCEDLLHFSITTGTGGHMRLLVDEVTDQGDVLKKSRRLWPQAELIKAHIMQFDAKGNASHLRQADAVAAELFRTYFAETPTGTWRDCFDLEGRSLATIIPASSHYHLWTVVSEILLRPKIMS